MIIKNDKYLNLDANVRSLLAQVYRTVSGTLKNFVLSVSDESTKSKAIVVLNNITDEANKAEIIKYIKFLADSPKYKGKVSANGLEVKGLTKPLSKELQEQIATKNKGKKKVAFFAPTAKDKKSNIPSSMNPGNKAKTESKDSKNEQKKD